MQGAARWLQAAWARRGAAAVLLWPIGAMVAAEAQRRRRRAGSGSDPVVRLPVPVVVVGNLIVGGAGKTPATLAVVTALRAAGWHPGIVSRGYGRRSKGVMAVEAGTPASQSGDEPLLLRRRTGVPVVVGEDRVAAARALLARDPRVDLIVSDDGLQHHRLARDVQIVVFDERGAGNGWCLPAGPLREPMPAAPWPRTLVLYNAPYAATAWPGEQLDSRVEHAWPLAAWWRGDDSARVPLTGLSGIARQLVAMAGVARPARFFGSLEAAGLRFESIALPDHHAFETLDWPAGTTDIIVTEKDAVKLEPSRVDGSRSPRWWVAPLDSRLPSGTCRQLAALLPAPPPAARPATGHPPEC
jgi:tetraacyldisaccharide 4'-kinase